MDDAFTLTLTLTPTLTLTLTLTPTLTLTLTLTIGIFQEPQDPAGASYEVARPRTIREQVRGRR